MEIRECFWYNGKGFVEGGNIMNEKKFVFAIILAISITVIISVFAVANSLSENNEMAFILFIIQYLLNYFTISVFERKELL